MDLTPERKAKYDDMSHFQLLNLIRFAPVGAPEFQGETGEYIVKQREIKRSEDPGGAVADSKSLGWG